MGGPKPILARGNSCRTAVASTCAVGERAREVAHLAVHAHREGGLGEPGADCFGEVGAGGARGQSLLAPVGERDTDLGGGHRVRESTGRSPAGTEGKRGGGGGPGRPREAPSGAGGAARRGSRA